MKCEECKDTGVLVTGNNDLPCHCEAGDKHLFNSAWVSGGQITGAQMKRHFLNDSPEPITHPIDISELPLDAEKVKNDLRVMMDFVHEIALLSAESLPKFIDVLELVAERHPDLMKKFEGKETGLVKLKRLWAYTRFACFMANGVGKHYEFPDSDEFTKLSFPAPEIPENLKEQLRDVKPPKEWLDECDGD